MFGSAADSSKAVFGANFALNFILSASLNQLWTMVNAQQLFVMLPLCNVVLPINAAKFFGSISQIAAFEIYDFGDHILALLNIPATEPFSDNFEELGFESKYMLNNLGTMLIFYLLYPILMLVNLILEKFCTCARCCKKAQKRLEQLIYFKLLITVVFESYAIVALSCFVGHQILEYSSTGLTIQSVSCITFTVFILLMPMLMFRHVAHNFAKLQDYNMVKQVGTLYDELDIRKGVKIFYQPIFFLLRRLILVITIVHLANVLVGQIILIWVQSMISVAILSYIRAFQNKQRHRMEIFNEIILVLTLYTIMCFSDWLGDVELKMKIGYMACAFVGFHFLLNLVLIIKTTVVVTKRRIYMKYLRKRYNSERELRLHKMQETRFQRRAQRKERFARYRKETEEMVKAAKEAEEAESSSSEEKIIQEPAVIKFTEPLRAPAGQALEIVPEEESNEASKDLKKVEANEESKDTSKDL